MPLFDLIAAVIGLIALICFFLIGSNVKQIRKAVINRPIQDAWANYYVNVSVGDNHAAARNLSYIIFWEINQMEGDLTVMKNEKYSELKSLYASKYSELGLQFPDNPFLTNK